MWRFMLNHPFRSQGESLLGIPSSLARESLSSPPPSDELWLELLDRLSRRPHTSSPSGLYTRLLRDDSSEGESSKHIAFSTPTPSLSLLCRARINARGILARFYAPLLALGVSGLLIVAAIAWIKRRSRRARIVAALVQDVCDAIARQAREFNEARVGIPGVSVSQLRDHFIVPPMAAGVLSEREEYLSDPRGARRWVLDPTESPPIWKSVRAAILANANVRETVMMVEGEETEIWQWVGSRVFLEPHRD